MGTNQKDLDVSLREAQNYPPITIHETDGNRIDLVQYVKNTRCCVYGLCAVQLLLVAVAALYFSIS